jgi:hypothetical protein
MTVLTPAERMAVAREARAAKKAAPPTVPQGLVTTATTEPATEADIEARAAEQAVAREIAATPVPDEAIPAELLKTNATRDAERIAAQEDMRLRAARQRADASLAPPEPVANVMVRVTKQGDSKISMGIHVAGIGEAYYRWKEEFSVAPDIAAELEERYFVEIL